MTSSAAVAVSRTDPAPDRPDRRRGGFSPRLRALSRLLAAVALFAAVAACVSWFAIGWDDSQCGAYPGGIVIRDRDGSVLRVTLDADDVDCRPTYAAAAEDWIVKALVASEDGTFFSHCGVRPLSVLRALWQNVTMCRRISGASTITMQAVRLIAPHRKSYAGKFAEMVRALKMERCHDKLWILSQYLNRAPFGSNFVGIEAAANGWFGKDAKSLGLGEAAMLAGMVQAPSRFRPDRSYSRAMKRRDYVLNRMLELGMIDEDQRLGAISVMPAVNRAPRPFRAPHYCDFALRELAAEGDARRDVRTALDPPLQALCESLADETADGLGARVAIVVADAATGELTALACSGDYFDSDSGQFNVALAPRPAGSTLKPFLVAQAFDLGLATPERRLADVSTVYRGYRPANFDGAYRGQVSVRDALILSLNVPFVRLLAKVRVERFAALLGDLGFAHVGDPARHGLGLAIGNAEVTLVELVRAYARLARGGDGEISPGACHLVAEILSGAERAHAAVGHVADVPLPRFAWKTGTSSANRDAWTVAWNPRHVIGVWCGHLSGHFGDARMVGAEAAAPLAWSVARALYPQGSGPWFDSPGDLRRVRVCAKSGRPANPDCPETVLDFHPACGEPTETCRIHCRDLDGRAVEREDPESGVTGEGSGGTLVIAKPEPDAEFELAADETETPVACRVLGNAADARLWWFADGEPQGESTGDAAFVVRLGAGRHTVTCSTADGTVAEVAFSVSSGDSENGGLK